MSRHRRFFICMVGCVTAIIRHMLTGPCCMLTHTSGIVGMLTNTQCIGGLLLGTRCSVGFLHIELLRLRLGWLLWLLAIMLLTTRLG